MLMEQGEQHSLFQGLQTSQGVKLATMHDHQEGCLLLNLTCSAVHCHKDGDTCDRKQGDVLNKYINLGIANEQ